MTWKTTKKYCHWGCMPGFAHWMKSFVSWLIVMLNILSNLTAVNVPQRVLITWIRSFPDIRMLSYHWKWYCRNLLAAAATAAKSLQSCPTLCNPIDGSPPGSAVPGILQARVLEWVPLPSPIHFTSYFQTSNTVLLTVIIMLQITFPVLFSKSWRCNL